MDKSVQFLELSSRIPSKLANPHAHLKTITKEKHLLYYTKGIYEYFHYGDQSFNDQGWGCAYRSLQTILSWFHLQKRIDLKKMLTITEIQENIDEINYSNSDRIKNTNEWIGATEVSWIIQKLTGCDCRILHISDGKNIV